MIFLDNASTTELCDVAKNEIEKSHDLFYNPSAVYGIGLDIKNRIIDAKKAICGALGTSYNDNLIITGSATEADNLAIFGSVKKTGEQLVFGIGEHPGVYNCALELKARGYNVQFVPLCDDGKIDFTALKEILKNPTAFVSIMQVSNETGAINDIQKIVKIVKSKWPEAIVHCDGVQAFGKISVSVSSLGVDLYTISAHKIGGPKGIGALYVKNIKKLKPIIFGGGQEFAIRSGTENTAYILTLGEVCKNLDVQRKYEQVKELNQYTRQFFENAKNDGLPITLNSASDSSPYILSYSFEGVRGETLLHILELKDIIVGTGSACSSHKTSANRTLEAMGRNKVQNDGAIRISFSANNTLEEVQLACKTILEEYKKLKDTLA